MDEGYGKVAVLMGGGSSESEISITGGNAVLKSLVRSNVDAIGIEVGPHLLGDLTKNAVQRVFIMLHGKDGEDGKIQSVMEEVGVAYTGSGIYSSEFAMDKVKCKKHWQEIDLPTPDFIVLHDDSNWESIITLLGTTFVKPVKEGSSIGISKAKNSTELKQAYEVAKKYDSVVIAERYVEGKEFTISILGDKALPVIELKTNNVFYDYQAKYESNETQYICPCDLSLEKDSEIKELSIAAFKSLECYGWARVDIMQDLKGKFWLLEINTVPGMTEQSLVPMAAKAAGVNFDGLVLEILESSDLVRRGLK